MCTVILPASEVHPTQGTGLLNTFSILALKANASVSGE